MHATGETICTIHCNCGISWVQVSFMRRVYRMCFISEMVRLREEGGEGGKKEIPHTHTRQARWRFPKVFAERKLTLQYNIPQQYARSNTRPQTNLVYASRFHVITYWRVGGNLFQRTMPRTHNAQYTYSIMLMFSFDTSYLHHAYFPRPLHRKPPWQADVQSVHHAGGALRERLAHYDMREWQHDARALAQSAGQRDRG